MLKRIGTHPNIVTLFDIFVSNTELQLVLELLKGGELFDRMVEKGPYSEREASHHIRKIGLALKYLHGHGIVHRDLKPENLLLADRSPDSELKIADFGLSRIVDDVANSTMQTVCGTWAYCAPEVKTSIVPTTETTQVACYTAAVDLWSVGVILFVILGAYHPFDPDGDSSDVQLWERICSGVFDFKDPAWDNISEFAKDLIKRLIVVDQNKRYTVDQLLSHPWVNLSSNVPATPITPSIDKSLGGFVTRKKAQTPRANFATGFNPYQQVQVGAVPQMNYAQMQMHNQHVHAFGTSAFAHPPQPHFNQPTMTHVQQQQYIQPQTMQTQYFPITNSGFNNSINGGMGYFEHPPQANPGVTLDTKRVNEDKMEIASPTFK